MNTQSGKQAVAAAWGRVSGAGAAGAGELLERARRGVPRPGWVTAVARVVRRDPGKTIVFAVGAIVLGTMWVRLATGDASGARPATASARSTRGGDPGGLRTPSRRGAEASAAAADWRGGPISAPRNLFAIKFDYFPRDGTRAAEPDRGGEGFWEELGKSLASRTDEKKQRQVLIENLRLQAATLRLETTVMGARPRAVINGEMVGEGDLVASGSGATRTVFRVSKIEPRRIIVEREGIKLEIPMK